MNKPFRNIHGSKNRSSSTTFISLHFNKADEEQLQISYSDKSENANDNSIKEDSASESSSSTKTKNIDQDASDNEDKSSLAGDENYQSGANQKGSNSSSRESTPSRDSVVREYWSKISKRGASLDSDLAAVDKNQDTKEWQLFKDIKGKITKTLEERKSVPKGRDDKSDSDVDGRKSYSTEKDQDRTPTETEKLSLQLSPAIEASEIENHNATFGNYIDDELHKAKCEIISSKRDTQPSGTQFYLQQPTKNKDVSMTLSTLIAKRSTSIETAAIESIEVENVKKPQSTNTDDLVQPKLRSNNVYKHTLIKKCYYFVKSYWNHVIFRMFVLVVGLLFVPVPSWISGFVAGAFLSGYIVYCLFKPGKTKEAFVLPDFSQMPPSNIPVAEIEDEPIIYKVSSIYSSVLFFK